MSKPLSIILGIAAIAIGFFITIKGPGYVKAQYETQSTWIKVDAPLIDIDYEFDDDDISYRGVYLATIENKNIRFKGSSKSSKYYVDDSLPLYINPENYNEYHTEVYENEWVLAVILGIVMIVVGGYYTLNNIMD